MVGKREDVNNGPAEVELEQRKQPVTVELRQLADRSTKVKIKDIQIPDHELEKIVSAILTGGEIPSSVQLLSFSPESRKFSFIYQGNEYSVVGGGINKPLKNADKGKEESLYELPDQLRPAQSFRTVINGESGRLTYTKEVVGNDPKGGVSPETSEVILATMAKRRQELPDFPHAVPTVVGTATIEVEGKRSQVLIFKSEKKQTLRDALSQLSAQNSETVKKQTEVIKRSVHNLFSVLRQLHNVGQIHGDLTRRSTGLSANWGFTAEGEAVIGDWWHTQSQDFDKVGDLEKKELFQQEVISTLFGIGNSILKEPKIDNSLKKELLSGVIVSAIDGYNGKEFSNRPDKEVKTRVEKLFLSANDQFLANPWVGAVVNERASLEERSRLMALINTLRTQNAPLQELVETVVSKNT